MPLKDSSSAGNCGKATIAEPDMKAAAASPVPGPSHTVLPACETPLPIAGTALATHACSSPAFLPTILKQELHTICDIVKAGTGHDFSSYKANTVMRRIERRMTVNELCGIEAYIALLQDDPQEAQALGKDILIGVTSFFRDPEAFDYLRQEVIPRLFADRDPADTVRIWHAGCATGEEAYSMAMLIREYLDERNLKTEVQIFASDLDESAVAQARTGLYDYGNCSGVGERRLGTFFTKCEGSYQVKQSLREMIIFTRHSLIKDPPFSRLDLLVCRNFLIYLNADMQMRLISLFHQVLQPGGFLFLGCAESVGQHSDLFATVNKQWKVYTSREAGKRGYASFSLSAPVRAPGRYQPARLAGSEEASPAALAEKVLLERYALPSVVVNEKHEVVHFFSRTGRFLELPQGEPTRDVLRMAREELRPALRAAIYKGFAEQREVVFKGVKVGEGASETTINVLATPLASGATGKLLLVIFEPAAAPASYTVPADQFSDGEASRSLLISQLEEQLRITHEQLQATTDQLETSNEGFLSTSEELVSINEEFQSANEELQSTNEELETSKEELQALNEELATVNAELHGKVEELSQATSNMENLLASSEIASIFLDRGLDLRGFTPAAAALFNLIPADTGRPFRHFAGRIDWPSFAHDADTVLAGEPFSEREVRSLDSEHCYLKRVFPYRTPKGDIDGIVVTLIDITERKRMEDELRNSESKFSTLFRKAALPAVLTRLDDHVFVDVNEAWTELFGYSKKELLGRTSLQLGISRDPTALSCRLDEVRPDNQLHKLEQTLFTKSGATVSVLTDISVLTIGGEDYALISVLDITQRKRAEAEVASGKRKLEAAMASMTDAVFISDLEGRFLDFNDAFATFHRFKNKDECAQAFSDYPDILDVFLPDGQPAPVSQWAVPRALRGETVANAEYSLRRKDTGQSWVGSYSFAPIRDQDGVIIGSVVAGRDITEQKRAEEALRQAKEAAEAATKAKSQFLANMSHELRTPMTGVLGMLDLVLMGNLEAKQREFICTAYASARSLLRILNDILDLTKIETGKLSMEEKPFSIRHCVENTFTILLPVARNKGLNFNFKVADGIPEALLGDHIRLNQVLTNLAGNAVKFTEKGSVEISVVAGGSAPDGRQEIVFSVTDSGIGIAEKSKDLLFREFSQVDDSHTRRYGGTGLGLAISKEIVARMGGTIGFTSEEGRGSTFSFTVPLCGAEPGSARETPPGSGCGANPVPEIAETAEDATPAAKKARLLFAEDDPTIREVLQMMLQRSNFDIDIAENGLKAVEVWENGHYDLILMDVQMPHMNGFEATAAIREKERTRGGRVPIIAMTAHALKEDQARCLEAGMDAYVSKPIDFNACIQLIRETILDTGAVA